MLASCYNFQCSWRPFSCGFNHVAPSMMMLYLLSSVAVYSAMKIIFDSTINERCFSLHICHGSTSDYRAEMRTKGRHGREREEIFSFLVASDQMAAQIYQHGLQVGSTVQYALGKPSHGVYLFRHVDVALSSYTSILSAKKKRFVECFLCPLQSKHCKITFNNGMTVMNIIVFRGFRFLMER